MVLQHRLSRKDWDAAISWMQKNHNLWDFEPQDRKAILDYLEQYLAPKVADSMDGLGPRSVNPLPHDIK